MILLDTCAVIELCCPKPKFTSFVLSEIRTTETSVLSISFAELACKIKASTLDIGISALELYEKFQTVQSISIHPIDTLDWIAAIDLEWENRDPVDRVLVAFAKRKKMKICTTDKKIASFYAMTVW